MKTSYISAVAFFGMQALAFPPNLMDREIPEEEMRQLSQLAARIAEENSAVKRDSLGKRLGFDAEKQLVSISGDHEFMAPGDGDLRGPCPGLNAMANHGYIPRDGVATITQFIEGTYDAFGMGVDLSTILAIYGAVFDGDLVSWSIGGAPPGGLLENIGLLGKPQGISGSHNKYEADVSPTRGDKYQYGNGYELQVSQFEELYNMPMGEKGYDVPTLTAFRKKRFEESKQNNPYFFNGPFTGVIVQPAAYYFIYRFMGNKSEEHPDGYLDKDVLKSFMSITGDEGDFTWTPGHEKFPENFYKRAIGDEYSVLSLTLDTQLAALANPEFYTIGGNTGKVNSFVGVDLTDITDGVFNVGTLLEGDNLLCFVMQAAQQAAPDILKGLFASITKPLSQLSDAVGDVLGGLACPELEKYDTSEFDKFPGAKGAY